MTPSTDPQALRRLTGRLAGLGCAAALCLAAAQAGAASAAFTFIGTADSGPHVGQSFSGSFAFDDAAVTPGMDGDLPLLQFSLQFMAISYSLASGDAPATASFIGGSLAGLSFVDTDSPDANTPLQVVMVPGFMGLADAYLAYETAAGLGGFGSYSISAVPEPATVATLLAGLVAVGGLARRARRRAQSPAASCR